MFFLGGGLVYKTNLISTIVDLNPYQLPYCSL